MPSLAYDGPDGFSRQLDATGLPFVIAPKPSHGTWAYGKDAWKSRIKLEATGQLTRPYRPQTNGKVERFNRTLFDEWTYLRPYTSNDERSRALADFLHTYNHHCCHTALDGQPPITRVNNPAGQYT